MSTFPLKDIGAGLYLHETPSARYPVYTRGNAGEVWPEVVYPLSLSLSRLAEDPIVATMVDTGLFTRDELAEGTACAGGAFGGYMYLNLSVNRVIAVRSPGVTVEESDAIYMGSEGVAPPLRPDPEDKSLKASVNVVRYMLKVLRTSSLPQLEADRRDVDRSAMEVPALLTADDAEVLAALRARIGPVMELFAHHIEISGRAGAAVTFLSSFCETNLGDRSLALSLISGLGDVDSAAPSFGLWDLGRIVEADPALTEHFDRGIDGLAERLAADPAAVRFNEAFARFIATYGSRGPNEWETACDTWETRPELALALIDRMRLADERQSPANRLDGLVQERERLVAESRQKLTAPLRPIFDRALRAAMVHSAGRERSKTTVVDLIHQSRLVSRELARRCASRVDGGTWEDLWFVFADELDAYVADPAAFVGVIAERRTARELLATRVPPFVFEGDLPPFETWEKRGTPSAEAASPLAIGESLHGLPAVTGVTEGRACIVTDPADPRDLGPGDVLVAPLTDPAWTPLFIAAEAVVVDVGGQMSHAVIVAREFGMPCVVAATGATQRIPDGARIRVDGAAGTITRLD